MTQPPVYPYNPASGYPPPPPPPPRVLPKDAYTPWGSRLLAVYFFWNFCYRQGKTGQSVGKSVLKFMVINEKTWQPIGFWRSFLRQVAHYVDQAICYIGYLLPLWDDKRQTIADKIMSTVCVPVGTPLPPPRLYSQPY